MGGKLLPGEKDRLKREKKQVGTGTRSWQCLVVPSQDIPLSSVGMCYSSTGMEAKRAAYCL
jgi:hypothetical protein